MAANKDNVVLSYRDLRVWKKSFALVKEIYLLTKQFPPEELYGLSSQMRRAAVSIPSNIAEGYTRKHRSEYVHFVRIAFGSGAELETQLLLAKELGLVSSVEVDRVYKELEEIMKMLNKLLTSLANKS